MGKWHFTIFGIKMRFVRIYICIWVRSWKSSCLVTWFCYHLIAKPGNKTAAPSWSDPYICVILHKAPDRWVHVKETGIQCLYNYELCFISNALWEFCDNHWVGGGQSDGYINSKLKMIIFVDWIHILRGEYSISAFLMRNISQLSLITNTLTGAIIV